MDISVVVPAFNAEKYLEETLLSLENQTVKPEEIVVVNDASTDNTAKIARKYGARVISHETNMGIGASRQHGAEAAEGNLVAFLSADDVYHPRFLEKSLRAASLDHATFTDYYRCNSRMQPLTVFKVPCYETQGEFRNLVVEWALHNNMFVNFSTVIIPRDLFRKICFEEELRHGEDLIFLLDTVIEGVSWVHIPEPLLYYRIHGKMGSRRRRNPSEWSLHWRHLAERLRRLGVDSERILRAMQESRRRFFPSSAARIKKKLERFAHAFLSTYAPWFLTLMYSVLSFIGGS